MSHPPNAPARCCVDDCERNVYRGDLCRGHYARQRTGKAVRVPLRPYGDPKRALLEAALAVADALDNDESQWERAWNRLYKAAVRVSDKVPSRPDTRAHEQRKRSTSTEVKGRTRAAALAEAR